MSLRWTGQDEMKRRLLEASSRYPKIVAAALTQEAAIEMTESKRRCPVDVTSKEGGGTLRASGTVQRPVYSGRNISVALTYGGAASAYAVIQHENPDYHHNVGQWKYLESVLDESRPHMGRRLAARVSMEVLF